MAAQITRKLPSLAQLNHLLQLCAKSKVTNQVQQIHQQIAVSGAQHDPFTATKLTQAYSDCDDLVSAQNLFDELPQPNVFAWTALFWLYLTRGMYEKLLQNYGLMKLRGVLPDSYVFPKAVRACAQLSWLEGGAWVHKDVVVCGCASNSQVCNSLIDMYAKCGDFTSARWVFEEMARRDLSTWNLMISGCVLNGRLDSAVEFSHRLKLDGLEPDVVTWNTLMDGYCRMGLCDEAWKVFEQIKEPNIISWTTLILCYSRIGQHVTSLGIFKDMVNRGMVSPDVDCLSSVLSSCRHLRALMRGKEIHGSGMKMCGMRFYSSAGAALVIMYAQCGRIQDARNVFKLMDKSDAVTWNAMICGFVELELRHFALECFCEMQRLGIKINHITICTVLPVCDLEYGKQIHAYIRRNNFGFDASVWNTLIQMYCKCGCIRSAFSVFSNMVTKDLVSWNTMIGGFSMHGLGQAVLQLLQDMTQSGLTPDSMTFTSVLSACRHSGFVDEGLRLFHNMTEVYGITPRMEHYSCLVDMLANAGRLESAVSWIHKMHIKPDKHVWGALLAACQAHQNINFGMLAAEQLIHLEPEQAGHYVTLSNIYARAGRWDDTVRVRKQMEGRGLVKPSGQSWI